MKTTPVVQAVFIVLLSLSICYCTELKIIHGISGVGEIDVKDRFNFRLISNLSWTEEKEIIIQANRVTDLQVSYSSNGSLVDELKFLTNFSESFNWTCVIFYYYQENDTRELALYCLPNGLATLPPNVSSSFARIWNLADGRDLPTQTRGLFIYENDQYLEVAPGGANNTAFAGLVFGTLYPADYIEPKCFLCYDSRSFYARNQRFLLIDRYVVDGQISFGASLNISVNITLQLQPRKHYSLVIFGETDDENFPVTMKAYDEGDVIEPPPAPSSSSEEESSFDPFSGVAPLDSWLQLLDPLFCLF